MTLRPDLEKLLNSAKLKPSEYIERVERLSTGSLLFDAALGGGWARGRFNMLWGVDNTGKTTLALLASAQAQADPDAYVVYIDTENKLDLSWARALGVDLERLAFYRPSTGEEAADIVLKVLDLPQRPDLVVVDSLAAMPWVAEVEGDMFDMTMGVGARKTAQFCRKAVGPLANTRTVLLLLNQATEIISASKYQYPLKPKGGRHVAHTASIRVETRGLKKLLDSSSNNVVGMTISVHVDKNQTANNFPPKSAEVNMLLNPPRVDQTFELVMLGKDLQVFTDESGEPISGARKWHFEGQPIGVGAKQVMAALADDPALFEQVRQRVFERLS